jgi:hypothetical protein
MGRWSPKVKEHGEFDLNRLNEFTRGQLLAVSCATTDRTLKPTRVGVSRQVVGRVSSISKLGMVGSTRLAATGWQGLR